MISSPFLVSRCIKRVWAAFFICLITNCVQAQLCTGSLGEPVVNITFGTGTLVGSPLGTAGTSYTYVNSDCPIDGTYTVRTSTSNCFSTWHTLNTDHTGDPQGRFMLVNASFDPGDFFVETVSGLCANTTYEFAAWVMNMVRFSNQIQPNITFTIEKKDGTVLGLFQSGDIDISGTPQWKKYGFNFKTPPGVFEVVLRIRNNAPGGIGNDLALDDITFRACGPALVNTMDGNSEDTVHLCEGIIRTFDLNATVPAFFSNPAYQWQESNDGGLSWHDIPGANTLKATVSPKAVGQYWYRFSASEAENFSSTRCRIVSNVTAVVIHANPGVDAGPNKVVIKGESVALNGRLLGEGGIFTWSPGTYMDNTSTLTPNVSPLEDISYTLSGISPYGCTNTDDVFVKVINGIYIPTSFTPNGDGLNDVWRIPFIEHAPEAEVKIYNRNGNLVYQQKGGAAQWDGTIKGKPQPVGVYIYLVTLRTDGTPLKGFITLLR